jgi:hypothetical protein
VCGAGGSCKPPEIVSLLGGIVFETKVASFPAIITHTFPIVASDVKRIWEFIRIY